MNYQFSLPLLCFSSHVNQMSGGVTIVKVGGNQSPTNSNIIRTAHTDNVGRNSRFFRYIQFIFKFNVLTIKNYIK